MNEAGTRTRVKPPSTARTAMWAAVGSFYLSGLALVLALFGGGSLNWILGWLCAALFTGIGAKLLMDFVAGEALAAAGPPPASDKDWEIGES